MDRTPDIIQSNEIKKERKLYTMLDTVSSFIKNYFEVWIESFAAYFIKSNFITNVTLFICRKVKKKTNLIFFPLQKIKMKNFFFY